MPKQPANGILLNNIINIIIGITYMVVYYKKKMFMGLLTAFYLLLQSTILVK